MTVNDKKVQTEAEKMGTWNEVAGWKSTGGLLAVEREGSAGASASCQEEQCFKAEFVRSLG